MRLSASDVTATAMSFGGSDRGRWMGDPKGAKEMVCMTSALETPWLMLGGPFLSSYAQTD